MDSRRSITFSFNSAGSFALAIFSDQIVGPKHRLIRFRLVALDTVYLKNPSAANGLFTSSFVPVQMADLIGGFQRPGLHQFFSTAPHCFCNCLTNISANLR